MIFAFKQHEIVSYSDGRGGTITYYYYDAYTWIIAALAAMWLIWFLVSRYRRARALRRTPRPRDHRALKRVVSIKNQLSQMYLQPGFSSTIHAVGVGRLAGTNDYCIQVFISDPDAELWRGAGNATLPASFQGVPVEPITMSMAGFLSEVRLKSEAQPNNYPNGIRDRQEVIIGGISGANTNLSGQCGTIGYFCTRRNRFLRKKGTLMLSNAHVLADLRKVKIDETDLILQPSPGEIALNRPVGSLIKFSPLRFDGDMSGPNHIDAAIAGLSKDQKYEAIIPLIGSVTGYVPTRDIEIGEVVRKSGRTTGYTVGVVTSINLDIKIRYDRTGETAFFKDQILVEPSPKFSKFVFNGDSGSLLVDAQRHAVGLIFAGTAERPPGAELKKAQPPINPTGQKMRKIEGYGVANPIGEVLDRLKIDLEICDG